MAEFGFLKVGDGVTLSLSIIVAPALADAKRLALETIMAEGLDAVRLWVDGRDVVEVRRPPLRIVSPTPPSGPGRGERMLARRSEGAKIRDVAEEFGVSVNSVRESLAVASHRAKMRVEQPNRAALPPRSLQALIHLIVEPEADPAERDRLLPERVAALTRRSIENVPNIGKATLAKIEAWLWDRGLSLG